MEEDPSTQRMDDLCPVCDEKGIQNIYMTSTEKLEIKYSYKFLGHMIICHELHQMMNMYLVL